MTGLYSLGATCSNKTGQTYASSYDAWGNVTSRNVNGTTATLSYDGLDHLTKYDAGSNGQEQYIYDASGERVLRRSTSAGATSMTVYAFGLEEHLYNGTGVHQSDTYYYSLGGVLVGESTGSGTNMFLTDALGSSYDLLGRAACLQDAAPTTDGSQLGRLRDPGFLLRQPESAGVGGQQWDGPGSRNRHLWQCHAGQ